MVEKVNKKLSNQKKNYISFGGRITLIKFAFGKYPYLLHAPFQHAYKGGEGPRKISTRFPLGRGREKKDHLVSWEVA